MSYERRRMRVACRLVVVPVYICLHMNLKEGLDY